MIGAKDTPAQTRERESRAKAYAIKMGQPVELDVSKARVDGAGIVIPFVKGAGKYKDPDKRKEYRREWMRKKRAAK